MMKTAILLAGLLVCVTSTCQPGTYLEKGTCFECPERTYTDGINHESCQPQPYCSSDFPYNMVFIDDPPRNKKIICRCLPGFWCPYGIGQCFTCEPHSDCKEGEFALVAGTETTDTQCYTFNQLNVLPESMQPVEMEEVNEKLYMLALLVIPICAIIVATMYFFLKRKFSHLPVPTEPQLDGKPQLDVEAQLCKIPQLNRSQWKLIIKTTVIMIFTIVIIMKLVEMIDVCLKVYCDNTGSINVSPLGFSVTPLAFSKTPALKIEAPFRRCTHGEFQVPGLVKFSKAVKCKDETRKFKAATDMSSNQGQSMSDKKSQEHSAKVSGGAFGVKIEASASYSKSAAMEESLQNTVVKSGNVAASMMSYQCSIGTFYLNTFEVSDELIKDIKYLNRDPGRKIETFLSKWGYAVVYGIVVGGYYSQIQIYTSCAKEANSLVNMAVDKCSDAEGSIGLDTSFGGAGIKSKASDCKSKDSNAQEINQLRNVSVETQKLQIGGNTFSNENDWRATLKNNPYPLEYKLMPIYELPGLSVFAKKLIEFKSKDVQLPFQDSETVLKKINVRQC